MKTRSNMPLFVVECSDVKALSNSQIDLLRCGDYLVKKDASGEHAYKVTFKSKTGMCITYHDASVIETQSYDKVGDNWVYNSEDKTSNLLELPATMEDIKDKDGHNRFIEGDIDFEEGVNITKTYGKWALSGTHLLIVLAGTIANGVTIAPDTIAKIDLPQWIKDKIYPTVSTIVETKSLSLYASDLSSQSSPIFLEKYTGSNQISIYFNGVTATADRALRITFDLLIDNE